MEAPSREPIDWMLRRDSWAGPSDRLSRRPEALPRLVGRLALLMTTPQPGGDNSPTERPIVCREPPSPVEIRGRVTETTSRNAIDCASDTASAAGPATWASAGP